MSYQHIKVPHQRQQNHRQCRFFFECSFDEPIIPFIEGDGTGADITPVMLKVVDAAVGQSSRRQEKIHWMEVYAGEKSTKVYDKDTWLPAETMEVLYDYVVSIKGP